MIQAGGLSPKANRRPHNQKTVAIQQTFSLDNHSAVWSKISPLTRQTEYRAHNR